MVAAAQRNPILVGEGDDVVRMDVAEGEADEAAPLALGPDDTDAGKLERRS